MSTPAGPLRRDGQPPPASPWRHWRWYVAAVLALVVVLALLRQPLAQWLWPANRIDVLLAEGAQALAAGRLDVADGSGARQKFEAALALDEDRREARLGLAQVGGQALRQAREAIRTGEWERARALLALARELQVPRAQLDAVSEGLREAETTATDLDALRARARQAMQDGEPELALPLLARVLSLQAGNAAALEAREDALAALLQRAHAALAEGGIAAAAALVDQARGYDPGHVDLPGVQAALAEAVGAEVARARRDLGRGHADAAAARLLPLRVVAAQDPAFAAASAGVADALAQQATRLSADFHFDAAAGKLARAADLAPGSATVAAATRELQRDRQAARLRGGSRATPQAMAALRRSLQALDAAIQRGDWIAPPGASAFDHLRVAQAIAPDHRDVRTAAARLQVHARSCVEQGLRGNRLSRAQACYDAWRAVGPGDPALDGVRRRLVRQWLGVAEERLRAGDLDMAARALEAARRLDPAAEGLEPLAAQLDRARG